MESNNILLGRSQLPAEKFDEILIYSDLEVEIDVFNMQQIDEIK